MRTYVVLFFVAALSTVLVTPLVRRLALSLKAFGVPGGGRELSPVPRLGGLAILTAILASCAVLPLVPTDVGVRFVQAWQTWALLLGPAIILVAIGVIDDISGSQALMKFGLQSVVAVLTWWAGFRIEKLPIAAIPLDSELLSLVVTCFWIVAVTNSLNLIDGLDGLASGIAFFVSATMFMVAVMEWKLDEAAIAVIIAGALLGFLRYNFPPAQIYLGDTGSLLIGYLLSVLAITASQKGTTLIAIVVPYVALGLPLLDTGLAVLRRLVRGQPLFAADADHIHHRALARLKKPRLAALLLYAAAALFSLGSLFIVHVSGSVSGLIAVLGGLSAWLLAGYLKYEEVSVLNDYIGKSIQGHRRLLSKQIELRDVSRRLQQTASVQDAWALLTEAFTILQIDSARCEWYSAAGESIPIWRHPEATENGARWTVRIPLRNGVDAVGELLLEAEDWLWLESGQLVAVMIELFSARMSAAEGCSARSAVTSGAGSTP